ncbi:biopolymer transport protein ExbB [Sphaerotilus hippei]|uniref:Biopolymer transport protein ExbB n=1 Tax=Sphaerotilus hippei TaxID=744406 RepID=A0A318HAT4_9BURK|nr:MotA/TolQ/ExbB proton channel family protein [Sphaerotilus hippei]PXW95831.1 biopolymer transport protein ExbB [Sphaerotilus hippei]
MGSFAQIWSEGDGVSRVVALLLMVMSVAAWVLIFWKSWVLTRVRRDLARAVPAFWSAGTLDAARAQLQRLDREQVLMPLLDAAQYRAPSGTLEAAGHSAAQLTRHLRDALHRVVTQLRFGQVLLASVGATAPFIGLFGTVWGIYHALLGVSAAGTMSIDQVAGPVGEALVMTAAGLAVAIPAVLAYNLFGQWVHACETELEGHAHDLREMVLDQLDPQRTRTAAPDGD